MSRHSYYKKLDIAGSGIHAAPYTTESPRAAPTAGGMAHGGISSMSITTVPTNAVTGEAYQGNNVNRLLVAELERGYGPGGWAGFKQWLTAGRVVRKGERGTRCQRVVTVTDEKTGRARTTVRG